MNPRVLRRVFWWLAAIVAVALVAVMAAHLPFVRSRVLAWARTYAADQLGLVLNAERLDYNILRRSVTLRGLSVAAGAEDPPFLSATSAHVVLDRSLFRGTFEIERIDLVEPRVSIVRRADGTTNLPRPREQSESATTPIELGEVSIRQLAVQLRDEISGRAFELGPLDLSIRAAGTGSSPGAFGPSPFAVRVGESDAWTGRVAGRLGFDGTRVSLPELRVETPAGQLTGDGWVDVIAAAPKVDVRAQLKVNLAGVQPFLGSLKTMPTGTVTAWVEAAGPLAAPAIQVEIQGGNVAYGRLTQTQIRGNARLDGRRIHLQSLEIASAHGQVWADGEFALPAGADADANAFPIDAGRLAIDWHGLDVDRALDAAGYPLPVRVGTQATGSATLTLDRYAAASEDSVPAVDPHSGPRRAERAEKTTQSSQGRGRSGSQGQRPWLDSSSQAPAGQSLSAATQAGALASRLSGDASNTFAPLQSGFGLSGPTTLTLRRGNWSLDHRLATSLARATLAGTLTGRVTAAADDSTLAGSTRLDVPDLTAATAGLHKAGFDMSFAEARDLSGSMTALLTPAGTVRRPRVGATVSGHELRMAGVPPVTLDATLIADTRAVRVSPLDAAMAAAQMHTTGEYTWDGRLDARFDVSVPNAGALAAALDWTATAIAGAARLDGHVRGPVSALAGEARLSAQGVEVGDVAIGQVAALLTLDPTTLHVDAVAPDLALIANGRVATTTPYAYELQARADNARIPALLPPSLQQERQITDGVLTGGVHARGTFAEPSDIALDANVAALDLTMAGTRIVLTGPARVVVSARAISAENVTLRVGETTTVSLDGALTARTVVEPIVMRAQGRLSDVLTLAAPALPSGTRVTADGTFALDMKVGGTVRVPEASGTLTVQAANVSYGDLAPMTDVRLDVAIEQSQVALRSFTASWQEASLSGEGVWPLGLLLMPTPGATPPAWAADWVAALPKEPRRASLTLRLKDLTPGALQGILARETLRDIEGRLSATLTVETDAPSLDRVQATLVLDEAEGAISGVPFKQTGSTRFRLENGYAWIDDFRWSSLESDILVSGGTSITAPKPWLDLGVTGELDLRVLGAFTPNVATAGSARVDLTVGGPLEALDVLGRVAIDGGEVRLDSPRLIASEIEGVVRIATGRVATIDLNGTLNGGATKFTGEVSFKAIDTPVGRITVDAQNVALEYPSGLQTESNARLTLTMSASGMGVGGRVDVLNGVYREPLLVTGQLFSGLQGGVVAAAPPSDFLSQLRLDVTLTTVDNINIDNNYARMELGVNLRIVGTGERPGVVGRIEAEPDGEIFLAGNTYLVERLLVELDNPRAIAPEVSFLAQTRVGNVPIEVELECTAERPCERQVRSQAAGVTDAEAEALLFGISSSPTESGQQLARLLSGEVLGVVGRTMRLDTLRLEQGGSGDLFEDPTLVAGDVNPASRLTLGKRLGENVEIAFSQNLADNGFTWSTTYQAPFGLSFRGLLFDDQSRSLEFRHEPRFGAARHGGPARRPRPRIEAVRITGTPGFPEEELRRRLRLTEGDRFDFGAWQRDQDRLRSFYHDREFLEARLRARRASTTPAPDGSTAPPAGEAGPKEAGPSKAGTSKAGPSEAGPDKAGNDKREPAPIVLDYEIERGLKTHLEVQGATLPDELRTRILERWSSSIFDGFLERDAQLLVREHLYRDGHLQARIETDVAVDESPDPTNLVKTLRLDLTPGPVLARRLEFTGHEAVPASALYERARAVGTLTAWLDPRSFERAIERLYREEGLLSADAQVQPPEVQSGTSIVCVAIIEGPVFTIGRLKVSGAEALPEATVNDALGLSTGTRYKPAAVTEAVQRLERTLQDHGFLRARVAVDTIVVRERAQVDIEMVVDSGPRAILQEVVLEGADPKKPIVARAITLTPGEPVNPNGVRETRSNLYDIGLFRRVDVRLQRADRSEQTAPASSPVLEQPVIARIVLEERPRYRFRYGLAFSDDVIGPDRREQHLGLAADLETRHLIGIGSTIGLSARLRQDFQVGRLFVGSNRFFGLPLRSTVYFTRSREESSSEGTLPFQSDVTEVFGEQSYRVKRFAELRYGYGFGQNQTTIEGQDVAFKVRVARLTSSGLVDRRDNAFDPTGGWFSVASTELSRPGLGSDISFLKGFLQHYQFVRLRGGIVFATGARVGLARTFDAQVLIPSERFFAGGATTLRGYREDELGPRGDLGDADGGRGMLLLNEEVRFPLYRWVRGVGFVDLGNVYPTVGDISLSDLQVGVGVGLRFDTPVGLFRLDLGFPTNPRPFDPTWRVHFGLGHAF